MENKKKHMRKLTPSMRLYFVVMIIFAAATAATALLEFNVWPLVGAEAFIILALTVYSAITQKKTRRDMLSYVESVMFTMDTASNNTLMGMPFPIVIFDIGDGKVVWSNDLFLKITGDRAHFFEIGLEEMAPGLPTKWLVDGHSTCPETVVLGKSIYRVYGNIVRAGDAGTKNFLGMMYFAEITDLETIRKSYVESRPVMAIIMLDNYDELFRNVTDTVKSNLQAAVDNRISAWISGTGGYLTKYDRDRYIFIFEEQYLQKFIDSKFALLDSVREITAPTGIAATLSIGMGRDASGFDECFQFASLAIEMALSRGGDQVVIKNRLNFEFYGGHSMAVERRTKVKSRVMASAMGELIADASQVLIIGHKYADLDCIGAAAGLCCITRKRGKRCRFVYNGETSVAGAMVEKLHKLSEYDDVFISPEDAMLQADGKTLLIVVDTNRPEQVESVELLESCNKVAVIDHHRRAANYIATSALNFHEPYASSTSELVAELLQYLSEPADILKPEAEALMAGIVLDTKNFSMRTGSRTFEAAAFLRRSGSDTTEVKKIFQSDLKDTVAKYRIIQNARVYRNDVAISVMDSQEDRIIAAQASDELLNINGISASFVVYYDKDIVNISARSISNMNVQVVLEALGGGGNKNMAGAQITGKPLGQVLEELKASIDRNIEEME